jgi:hypothetical protein
MISVQLLVKSGVEFEEVTMFKDETISVTSQLQNIIDISKTSTDFSQSFTVPCDNINNRIFKHWYENFLDNSINANNRIDAIILIDTKVFRSGNVQLNKVQVEDGKPKNYNLTFFGKLVNLKDLIKEDKLKDLQTLPTFAYSPNEVRSRVKSDNNDISFPLISSDRYWQYNNGDTVNDITLNSGAILTTDLFPAVRVKTIFDSIATKYDLVFESDFFDTLQFTELFLHFKNKETFVFLSQFVDIDYLIFLSNTEPPPIFGSGGNIYNNGYFIVNKLLNTLEVVGSITPGIWGTLSIQIFTTGSYTIEVYKNNNLYLTFNGTGDNTHFVFQEDAPTFENAGAYYFKARSTKQFGTRVKGIMNGGVQQFETANQTVNSEFTGNIDLQSYAPDIKVIDFMTGILKMFNLAIYNESDNIYTVEPLNDYYDNGTSRDLTAFVEDKNDLERIKSFSKVVFKYQKSENFMNSLFFQNNGIEYGELQATFNSDGGQYDVTLPFENILFNRLKTDLQVGYYLKTDYITKLIPKPVLLYRYNDQKDITTPYVKIKKVDTNTVVDLEGYIAFGQDVVGTDTLNHSMNFGFENSTLLDIPIENGLYFDYYQEYLANVYNPKSRNLKVKAKLTPALILNLRLNDRIILFQKAYLINQFTTDLTTGIVNLDLLSDFRTI